MIIAGGMVGMIVPIMMMIIVVIAFEIVGADDRHADAVDNGGRDE